MRDTHGLSLEEIEAAVDRELRRDQILMLLVRGALEWQAGNPDCLNVVQLLYLTPQQRLYWCCHLRRGCSFDELYDLADATLRVDEDASLRVSNQETPDA